MVSIAANVVSVLLAILPCVSGHAYVYWPASRNLKIAPHIAHCFNVPGPPVNFQSAHNAGGKAGPSDFAKGLCGNFGQFQPQENIANDGVANWGAASPVATYTAGGPIQFTIVNNAEHGGHYEFRLCDRKLDASIGSREDAARCFDANFLGRTCVPQCGCDSDRCKENAEHNSPDDPIYSHGPARHLLQGGHQVTMQLPQGLTCETCTIQWFWHTAWGEQFWNCIDIRIEAGNSMPTPALPSTMPPMTTLAPAPTPSLPGGGAGDWRCIWTTPANAQLTMRVQNEKQGRICWEFTVPVGTSVHYRANVDIYHSWNADTCCLFSGTGGLSNVVTFTPHFGSFGFCECLGWTEATGGQTCAGQATADSMICPVAGSSGDMCVDSGALNTRPASCDAAAAPTPTAAPPTPGTTLAPAPPSPPSPPACGYDWGSCLTSRCCASPSFTCYEQDASYAECRSDGCPAGWSCNVPPPPGAPLPETCGDFCQRSLSATSCNSYTDAATCEQNYVQMGSRTVPCAWTGCSESPECFADGAGMLECPSLGSLCTSGCALLCGRTDLSVAGNMCEDFSNDEYQCSRSYISKLGKKVPCKWTSCTCYADGETVLDCDNIDALCPASLLAKQ